MASEAPKLQAIRDQSLHDLERRPLQNLEGDSYLNSELRRLWTVPLKQLRLEDLRLLIGQSFDLPFLVPLADEHVMAHPLASGDFYPGDLLKTVAEVDESFWRSHRDLRQQLVIVLERALTQKSKRTEALGLGGELREALRRHRTALK